MAFTNSPSLALSLLALISLTLLCTHVHAFGRKVGARTEIEDVRTNEEVQKLGRFCVEEFNKRHPNGGENMLLSFMGVVEGQRQVVSGVKYYLKIAATRNGVSWFFDSVVLVKAWLHSKELLHFELSSEQPMGW